MRHPCASGHRRRLVVASIALLVALGGTSMAAVTATAPANSVGTAALKTNAVTNPKIRTARCIGDEVKNGSLKKADFARARIPAGPPGPEGPAGPAGPQGADRPGSRGRSIGDERSGAP